MHNVQFTLPEIKKYFDNTLLNMFVPTTDKRGLTAAVLFKRPYHNSEIDGQLTSTIGALHIFDLLCCEIPIGYAFAAPSMMESTISNFMLNVRSRTATGKPRDPQLKFRGNNFCLYADKRSDDIAIIIDRPNLVDVSASN